MQPHISVESISDTEFQVTVSDGATQSAHRVTVKKKDYERITGGQIDPGGLVKMSFEFLLRQESKESILPQFDLMTIARYFPTFEGEMNRRLSTK
jgi:hypothetical protein